jgi:hypothetical protein
MNIKSLTDLHNVLSSLSYDFQSSVRNYKKCRELFHEYAVPLILKEGFTQKQAHRIYFKVLERKDIETYKGYVAEIVDLIDFIRDIIKD